MRHEIDEAIASDFVDLPEWTRQPAPQESRPPRPLTPSDLGPDNSHNPPPANDMRSAAQRGILLHGLFQRLPDIESQKRTNVADHWLEKQKAIVSPNERKELIDTVLAVLENPEWVALFERQSLAEAPIAAVVGENVISGTVDRLLITNDLIYVVDFKTGRKVPEHVEQVPVAHLRQMAAYVAALEKIFPERPVKAGLLYSHGPKMLEISGELIERNKPGFDRT